MATREAKRAGLTGINFTRGREFRPIKSPEDKELEAAETARLIAEWLEAGNLPYVGEYGPREKDERAYKPVGDTRHFFLASSGKHIRR